MNIAILALGSDSPRAPSLDQQLTAARDLAAAKGWTVQQDCVFILPVGAASLDHPSLAALRKAAAKERIGAVVVHAGTNDALPTAVHMTLAGPLREAGIGGWSSSTGRALGSDTPTDRFYAAAYVFAVEMERERAASRAETTAPTEA